MLRIDLLRQSLGGLSNYRLRSFLTIFGIMWGIVAFIFSRAILDGFQYEQGRRFAALGQDMLVVNGGRTSLAGPDLIAGRNIELTLDDIDALAQAIPFVKHISPELVRRDVNVESKQERISGQVHGVWPVYQHLRSFESSVGRLLNIADEKQSRRVCILGADLADQLSIEKEDVPCEIKLAGLPYTVVGIARKTWHTFASLSNKVCQVCQKVKSGHPRSLRTGCPGYRKPGPRCTSPLDRRKLQACRRR